MEAVNGGEQSGSLVAGSIRFQAPSTDGEGKDHITKAFVIAPAEHGGTTVAHSVE